MRRLTLTAALAALSALLVLGGTALAHGRPHHRPRGHGAAVESVSVQKVRGELAAPATEATTDEDATDDAAEAAGRFCIKSATVDGEPVESLRVKVRGLDVATDAETDEVPVYTLFLVDGEGTATEFGDLRVNSRGRGGLRFDTRRETLPEGITSLAAYGGGSMEVRDADGNVALLGDIPEFVALDDELGDDATAAAFGRAHADLTSDAEDGPFGHVGVQRSNSRHGMFESIAAHVGGLDAETGSVTFVAVAEDGTETELGSADVRGRRDRYGAQLHLSTHRDDGLPEGGIDALAGQTLEVRDGDGNVLIAGTIPTIE